LSPSEKIDCGACIGTGLAGPTDGECTVCEGRGYFSLADAIPGPVRLARLRLEAQANDDNEIGQRDAVEMLSAVVTEYESLFELSRAERQRNVQRWYEQNQLIRDLESRRGSHECDGTNMAVAEDGRQYCAHCGWNDPSRDCDALPNQDCVIHLPRPDCRISYAHIIDACGAFQPQFGQMVSLERVKELLRLAEKSNKDWRWALDQLQSANVSAATRSDAVVADGVTLPVGEKPALTCHNGMPHYCPNCDRSFDDIFAAENRRTKRSTREDGGK
jgi:hypothetical protein